MFTGGRSNIKGQATSDPDPIVNFYNNTIYVNMILPQKAGQPFSHNSTLWAFRDSGDQAAKVFQTNAFYGPMAVYDTYDEPMKFRASPKDDGGHVLWVASNTPAQLIAYDTQDGSIKQVIDVGKLSKLGNTTSITSKVSITRQNKSSNTDVLVVGVEGADQQAYLLAIEASPDTGGQTLMWSVKMSEQQDDQVSWRVEGQVVNTVQPIPGARRSIPVKLGVIATVTERGKNYKNIHVKAVF